MTSSATASRSGTPNVPPAFPKPALADLPATHWHGHDGPDMVLAAPAAGVNPGRCCSQ
ncbi:hypothetical protein J7E91_31750 [Streptomyces sp. ISL-99]|uniref:hypothetical protein n=1 Tax=Streptomyces sp. ISL-99 TaxID=2819193 RepID=UPI001BECAA7F|nr:hypothetical protein [Streptomyces sp. ISL-99]MBT2529825.1 hypothetical protein [Streptomyces sp. ISL-99]